MKDIKTLEAKKMTSKITDLEGRLDAAIKRSDKKTKTTHTPGPWKVGTGWIMGPEDMSKPPICTIGVSETDDANARLIAAAPELLVALKHALPGLIGESERIARAAIAKAEGK